MHTLGGLIIFAVALAAACAEHKPPPRDPPQPTVFDDLVDKKRSLPADVEKAQREHIEELRRQEDAANGLTPAPPPR